MQNGYYQIKIRRTGKFKGLVRKNAEQTDGKTYYFVVGWPNEKGDHSLYLNE